MREEIRKSGAELDEAALEGVSGGTIQEVIQRACNHDCMAHLYPSNRSNYCAFEGTDAERDAKVYEYIIGRGLPNFHYSQCPYYKP